MALNCLIYASLFQSTHSVWSGTLPAPALRHDESISIHPLRVEWDQRASLLCEKDADFNPPTPCGVGLDGSRIRDKRLDISIHPLRVEWDANGGYQALQRTKFQSTHSVWSGTIYRS